VLHDQRRRGEDLPQREHHQHPLVDTSRQPIGHVHSFILERQIPKEVNACSHTQDVGDEVFQVEDIRHIQVIEVDHD
jgi:hypothetical protein